MAEARDWGEGEGVKGQEQCTQVGHLSKVGRGDGGLQGPGPSGVRDLRRQHPLGWVSEQRMGRKWRQGEGKPRRPLAFCCRWDKGVTAGGLWSPGWFRSWVGMTWEKSRFCGPQFQSHHLVD